MDGGAGVLAPRLLGPCFDLQWLDWLGNTRPFPPPRCTGFQGAVGERASAPPPSPEQADPQQPIAQCNTSKTD